MITRRSLLTLLPAALPLALTAARDGDWLVDFRAAQQEARKTGRPLLAFFTDSLGCADCRDLERDILTAPAFLQWARHRVVLVRVDAPENLAREPERRRQNERLVLRYRDHGVEEPPVLLALDSIGAVLGNRAFTPPEGRDPQAVTAALEAFLEKAGDSAGDAPEPDEGD